MSWFSVMPNHELRHRGITSHSGKWSIRGALTGLIGLLCVLAQPVSAQVLTEEVGVISARSSVYQKRFTELLLTVSSRDLHAGWQLARDLGRPVAPVLWQMLSSERSNVDRRLVLLIAAVLAEGLGKDARLFELLDQRQPMLQERIIAAMLMALGPHRTRPMEDFWSRCIGPNVEPEPLLGLAVRIACARFPDAAKGAPTTQSEDPGIVAAAAFSGLRMSSQKQKKLWRGQGRHAELFFRGALLGEGWRYDIYGEPPTLLDRASELLGKGEEPLQAARAAAMLLRARLGVLDPKGDRPDWRLLQLVASQSASRRALQTWLSPSPLAREEDLERLAVAHALYQPVLKTVEALREWSADPEVRRHIAVALAVRLAKGDVLRGENDQETSASSSALASTEIIKLHLPDLPELRFAVWASGGTFGDGPKCADPQLEQLASLISAGRVSREVVRANLEEALWRWGSHPGIGPWQQERLLIRDLMLVGSTRGGGEYQSHIRSELRYVARGLDRSDTFFSIAVEMYEFLSRPVAPVPAQYRLR
ncbi:MAG: hypothetical protein ACI9SE_000402 [Neolewinella sp.]|jgi:hypothetical protein